LQTKHIAEYLSPSSCLRGVSLAAGVFMATSCLAQSKAYEDFVPAGSLHLGQVMVAAKSNVRFQPRADKQETRFIRRSARRIERMPAAGQLNLMPCGRTTPSGTGRNPSSLRV
jgi:hypothetical protein